MSLSHALRRYRVLRVLLAPPRLILAVTVTVLVSLFLPASVSSHLVARLLIAWNTGACLYISMAITMMIRSSQRHMRKRALTQDDGALAILCLVVIAAVASLVAIAVERVFTDLKRLPM